MERNSHLKKQLEKGQASSRIINGSGNGDDDGDDIHRDDDLTRSAMSLSCDEQHPHLGGSSINFFFKDDILSEYKKAELEEELKSLKYENRLLKQDLMAKSEQIVLQQQQQQQQSMVRQMNQHNQVMPDDSEILPLINDEVISLDNKNFIEARRASQALLANQQHSDVTTDISETSPLVTDKLLHLLDGDSSTKIRKGSRDFSTSKDAAELGKMPLSTDERKNYDTSYRDSTTIGNDDDKESLKLSRPSKQDFDILKSQIRDLEKTKQALSMMNLEHVSTIEQLERQLLYGDKQRQINQDTLSSQMTSTGESQQLHGIRHESGDEDTNKLNTSGSQNILQSYHHKETCNHIKVKDHQMVIHESQHHHDDGTSIELDNHVNDGKLNINRSFDTMEEEADDSMMFSQKFLLQSTFPDEKTTTMDETCRFSFSRDVLANTDDIPTNGESRFILMLFFSYTRHY